MDQQKVNEILQQLREAVIEISGDLYLENAEVECSNDLKEHSATFTLTVTVAQY